MSYACLFEALEVVQHDFAERPVSLSRRRYIFQINRFRFLKLIIKKVTSSENGVDHCRVIRIQLQSFKCSCNCLTRFPVEQLKRAEIQVIVANFSVQLDSLLDVPDRSRIFTLLSTRGAPVVPSMIILRIELDCAIKIVDCLIQLLLFEFDDTALPIGMAVVRITLNSISVVAD